MSEITVSAAMTSRSPFSVTWPHPSRVGTPRAPGSVSARIVRDRSTDQGRWLTRRKVLALTHRITLIPGDGIGPEVVEAARRVIEATGTQVDWDRQPMGAGAFSRTGRT